MVSHIQHYHLTMNSQTPSTDSCGAGEMNICHIALIYMHRERWREIRTNEVLLFGGSANGYCSGAAELN